MKCIVFGGSGFVGSYLVERLKGEGHQVLSPNRDTCDTTLFADVYYWMKDVDVVFNCVALANFQACIDNPLDSYKTTFLSAVNILESARLHGIGRVVMSSSNIVYYDSNPYKVAVKAMEDATIDYVKTYKISAICLRYANIYGIRPKSKYKITTVIDAFSKAKEKYGEITIMGDGTQTRDYIHISDVVESNLYAMKSDYCGVVDICTGVNTSLKDIASYFKCPIKYNKERPGDTKAIIQSPALAISELGWKYRVSLKEGMKDVIKDRQFISVL